MALSRAKSSHCSKTCGTLDNRRNEDVHKVVVGSTSHTLVSPSDVERIGQAFWIIGTYVEQNRKRRLRVQTAASCVKRQLADWNAHSAGALITQPQNPLAICHHYRFDPSKCEWLKISAMRSL